MHERQLLACREPGRDPHHVRLRDPDVEVAVGELAAERLLEAAHVGVDAHDPPVLARELDEEPAEDLARRAGVQLLQPFGGRDGRGGRTHPEVALRPATVRS